MFTGIITEVGRIEAVEPRGDLRVRIGCGYDMAGVDLGASIACSGVCLTVVDKGDGWFAVDVSAETQGRTAPGMWAEGGTAQPRTRAQARRRARRPYRHRPCRRRSARSRRSTGRRFDRGSVIAATGGIAPYIASKGSIALDGVSLTVNEVGEPARRRRPLHDQHHSRTPPPRPPSPRSRPAAGSISRSTSSPAISAACSKAAPARCDSGLAISHYSVIRRST